MTSVLLNSRDHAAMRVVTRRGTAYGDGAILAPIFPAEFRNAQAHYPIVFRDDGAGGLYPVALFGLVEGRNLFLAHAGSETVWEAHYLPWSLERQPFMIGRSPSAGAPGAPGAAGDDLQLHVDLAHPRVRLAEDDDAALFDEHGQPTEMVERAASLLRAIHEGMLALPAFMDALLTHRLLESFVLDIESDQGGISRISGFQAIHEERLEALDAEALGALHRAGFLEPVYMAVASMAQLRGLIERHRRSGS
ncbi:SapC family protein [Roseateles sp. L2-2]|uniref:SapC family protein n=1 Tax=Roseateles TaxID=93681 RepID=UPI003D35E945